MSDRSIQQHINDDKDMLEKGTLSPQMRRHITDELDHLEQYQVSIILTTIMTQRHLRCTVMSIQKQTSVEFTRIDGDFWRTI